MSLQTIAGVVLMALGASGAVAAAGCSDTRTYPFDTSGVVRPSPTGTSAFPGATGSALPVPECPSGEPQVGDPCTTSGLACEYGTHVDARCSPFFECDGAQWWRRDVVDASACAVACPATRADIVDGAPCSAGDAGASPTERLCAYPVATCGCTRTSTGAFAWTCVPTEPGCERRPRLGHACSGTRSCDFGACAFENGLEITCGAAGVWLATQTTCPAGRTP